MEQAYRDYRLDSAPCKAGVRNQCAVRMSVALERTGFDLLGFPRQDRVHFGRTRCDLDLRHVLGAHELARYLEQSWGRTNVYRRQTLGDAFDSLSGRRGIIYFNNCFKRKRSDTSRRGDHIDLWTGSQYYNQVIHVGAGGDAGAGARLFRRADQVWFFQLN